MARVALLLVIVALIGAGCASGPSGDEAPPDGVDGTPPTEDENMEPAEIAVDLTGCTIPEAFARVPAAQVRPHVPDDFALATDDAGQAVVILGGLVCGDQGSLSKRGILAIFVAPTDESLMDPTVRTYVWEPEHYLVDGTAIGEAFFSLGANATRVDDVRASVSTMQVSLVIDAADFEHRIAGNVGAGPGGEAAFAFGHFREYSAADGGYVYLDASFEGPEGSTAGAVLATVETGAGTVARELIGETAVLPVISGDDLTYADAKVGFVPR